MRTNGTLGETLAWMIMTQNSKRQHASTLRRLEPYYVYKANMFAPTPAGLRLLEREEPSFIWQTFKFLTAIGYKIRINQTNRLEIEYTHDEFVFSNPLRRIIVRDRCKMVDANGVEIDKLSIKKEVERVTNKRNHAPTLFRRRGN